MKWHEFHHPEYPQSFGGPFLPNLTALDFLFNCGPRAGQVLGSTS